MIYKGEKAFVHGKYELNIYLPIKGSRLLIDEAKQNLLNQSTLDNFF
jgi:hypothetical protein